VRTFQEHTATWGSVCYTPGGRGEESQEPDRVLQNLNPLGSGRLP
jgi:hypothetical protein